MSAETLSNNALHGDTAASWRMHLAVAQIAYDKGLYSAAVRNYHSAQAVAESLRLGDADMSVGLVGLAKCLCELGNFEEAERLYERVLDIDQKIGSGQSSTLAEDLNHLAILYLKTNRLGEAESLLKKSAAILTAVDAHSIQLAAAERGLGYIYCQTGKLEEAERITNHALSISDTKAGRQTKVFAETLMVLGLVAAKKGHLSEAEELIERAIASFELLTGGEHPELAKFLDLAANIFSLEKVETKANELTVRAKAIRSHISAMDH